MYFQQDARIHVLALNPKCQSEHYFFDNKRGRRAMNKQMPPKDTAQWMMLVPMASPPSEVGSYLRMDDQGAVSIWSSQPP
jgi:hypothetical protein